MGVKLLVAAAFVLVLTQLWCCNGCLEEERIGLLKLQVSFNISWFPLDNTSSCCDWYGIVCNTHTGRVTHLYLFSARDWKLGDWYLNISLFLPFKQLTYLDLSYNRITGFEGWTEFSKLKYLYLSYNNFNNNILPSLSGLSFFKSLNISNNNLEGSLNRKELASLKNLEELELSGNKNISELVVSEDVGALPSLHTIYLDDMTTNEMPLLLKSLTPFSSLKTLSLGDNNLTKSTFHHELHSFKSLENLELGMSVVDNNFFHSLDALPYLKSLSFNGGYGLDNLQGLCSLIYLQSLDLSMNNFGGRLPPCLSNLTSLQHIDLSYSSLEGNLYSSLGRLTQLYYLDLSGNYFGGTLPSSLANLTFLQYLDLSSNSFVENLSSSPLTLITSIQYLDLSGNNFHIPTSLVPFYNFSNISYLDITGNVFYIETDGHNFIPKFQLKILYMIGDGCGGSFPRFLYNQHNLQIVDMSDNKMRGEFPHWLLENNTRLIDLSLSNNSLTGTITLPTHFHVNLPSLDISSDQIPTKFGLKSLDVSDNELNGSFPPLIANMSSLYYLDLSINHLSGELPKVLNFSQLNIFDISENDICGSLPVFYGSPLTEVYLAKNNLHGSLPWAFINSSSLRVLVIKHNFLTGTIPKWIGNLSYLNFLQLAHNSLEDKIPTELCMLDKLRFVDLSNNNLSGHIPPCLESHIQNTHGIGKKPGRSIEFTTKSFSYSYKGVALALLYGIDLSCNKLTGEIPHEFGNLTKIKVLNVSHNNLRGSIPLTFSNLKEIETLDLSHNSLEGKIPSQLTQLKSISSFSVAYNNLSGRTPDLVNQFATFENTSYEGNPFLCGKPLTKSCEVIESPLPLLEPSTNNKDGYGFMDMEVFYVSFGVSYVIVLLGIVTVLYINPYWRRVWFYFIERKMFDCYYFIVDLFSF